MEYLRLENNNRYALVDASEGAGLSVTIIPTVSIQDMYRIFSDEENTKRMMLETEAGDVIRIFSGYTQLMSIMYTKDAIIGQDIEGTEITDNVITVMFKQPDRLQEQISELQMAIVELAGMIGG